ncbi:hypothetical protein STRIP9103_04884, partial [Streptomyces ipomoeae 91-03]
MAAGRIDVRERG